MGDVIKLPGTAMSADEALQAEVGTYSKVVLMGITHDNKVYCSSGGDLTNVEVVYLCEILKLDVIDSGWMEGGK